MDLACPPARPERYAPSAPIRGRVTSHAANTAFWGSMRGWLAAGEKIISGPELLNEHESNL